MFSLRWSRLYLETELFSVTPLSAWRPYGVITQKTNISRCRVISGDSARGNVGLCVDLIRLVFTCRGIRCQYDEGQSPEGRSRPKSRNSLYIIFTMAVSNMGLMKRHSSECRHVSGFARCGFKKGNARRRLGSVQQQDCISISLWPRKFFGSWDVAVRAQGCNRWAYFSGCMYRNPLQWHKDCNLSGLHCIQRNKLCT